MENMLKGIPKVIVYLDDILISEADKTTPACSYLSRYLLA